MITVAVFDTHSFDRSALENALSGRGPAPTAPRVPLPATGGPAQGGAASGAVEPVSSSGEVVTLRFVEARLSEETVALAAGAQAVCVFVNDRVSTPVLQKLAAAGVQLVALRCAGFNNVDLAEARRLNIAVCRVPEYSPHAIAEHAVALILSLNRKLVRAAARLREGNFLLEGLVGFDLYRKTVGVVGTGRIGSVFAEIMRGFGCRVLALDPHPNPALLAHGDVEYCGLQELLGRSDIVSLHLPLTEASRHLLNAETIQWMKPGAMLINTGRGALVETAALMDGLKSGRIGAAGLDVYEEEEGVFFEDHSGEVPSDEKLTWLLMCPNVLVTAHQAFLTEEALHELAAVTVASLSDLGRGMVPRPGEEDGRRWLVGRS